MQALVTSPKRKHCAHPRACPTQEIGNTGALEDADLKTGHATERPGQRRELVALQRQLREVGEVVDFARQRVALIVVEREEDDFGEPADGHMQHRDALHRQVQALGKIRHKQAAQVRHYGAGAAVDDLLGRRLDRVALEAELLNRRDGAQGRREDDEQVLVERQSLEPGSCFGSS